MGDLMAGEMAATMAGKLEREKVFLKAEKWVAGKAERKAELMVAQTAVKTAVKTV